MELCLRAHFTITLNLRVEARTNYIIQSRNTQSLLTAALLKVSYIYIYKQLVFSTDTMSTCVFLTEVAEVDGIVNNPLPSLYHL